MEILWKDGHQSTYTFTYLRDACPCALCNEEREKSHRQPDQPAPRLARRRRRCRCSSPPSAPTRSQQVGNYAIRFDWNDGHKHGIFSWEYLREWCPCEECHARRHSTDGLEYDIETTRRGRSRARPHRLGRPSSCPVGVDDLRPSGARRIADCGVSCCPPNLIVFS